MTDEDTQEPKLEALAQGNTPSLSVAEPDTGPTSRVPGPCFSDRVWSQQGGRLPGWDSGMLTCAELDDVYFLLLA